MSAFKGIPAGTLNSTLVPNVVFSELVPLLDDLAELKVVLHVFYLLSQKKGSPRYVTLEELAGDAALMRGLDFQDQNLTRGLDKAVAHGALLAVKAEGGRKYLFNTPQSRRILERVAEGELDLGKGAQAVIPPAVPAPNIFKLYEQQIGMLTPLIADELLEAEKEYPPDVIVDAFRIAAENNARAWSYVRAILSDWARGKKHETTRRPPARKRRPRITGKLADVAKS